MFNTIYKGNSHLPLQPLSILFETANPKADPEGLITNFIAYESFRMKKEGFEFDMIGSLQDRLRVLLWYLSDYVRDRQFSFAVPLSARQIAYLNSPAPLAGVSPSITIALQNFVSREIPGYLNLQEPEGTIEAVYWWCIVRAPRSRFEDCLVTPEQISLLSAEQQFLGEEYPVNVFMSIFFRHHSELNSLDLKSPRDRAAYFYYLVLLGFTKPYILRFLPADALRRTLNMETRGASVFDQVLACHALMRAGPIEGSKLRERGMEILHEAGYSFNRDRGSVGSSDAGECFVGRRTFAPYVERGILLIGPIRKTSGLGQATRLSYEILRKVEITPPSALAFDLDNPAPVGFASDQELVTFRNRREINLLHLNAETVPLAYAFEQREIFASSYNIGFFFWELNMIPKCHRLALELLDEIWVSSEYNREIYSRFTQRPVINVGMAIEPLPKISLIDRETLGLLPDSFVFLTTFDSFSFVERKNPLGVLNAFKSAFPLGTEKVQLVLKTQNRSRVFDPYQMELWKRICNAIKSDRRIVLINETYKYSDLIALKSACDCYVSLHRSEGWGFGMIEAMQLGRPVIATAYSGNMEFCNAATAYLVDYDLISVREDQYIFVEAGSHWADPDIEQAATYMRAAVADPIAARAKGVAAAEDVQTRFSLDAIGRRYAARLRHLRTSGASATSPSLAAY